jgi:hypothetical protein
MIINGVNVQKIIEPQQLGVWNDKIIYICFAENILGLFKRIGGKSMELFPYYFPGLSKKGILSILDLKKEQQSLLNETKKIIDPKSLQIYENIDF